MVRAANRCCGFNPGLFVACCECIVTWGFLEEYIEKDILLDQINVLFKLRKYI
jgi:hypothetical protein